MKTQSYRLVNSSLEGPGFLALGGGGALRAGARLRVPLRSSVFDPELEGEWLYGGGLLGVMGEFPLAFGRFVRAGGVGLKIKKIKLIYLTSKNYHTGKKKIHANFKK